MNLQLLESFGQNYPEDFDGTLDCVSLAVTCRFNKLGTLLAVGCNDGRIVIWDFLTRGVAKIANAHVHPVCSVSWSRDGFKLVSASTDNNVAVWDVLTGDCDFRYRLPSPVLKVQFHPRNASVAVVSPMKHAPVLFDFKVGHHILPVEDEADLNIVSSFNRRGTHVYCGNAKGKIIVIDEKTRDVVASFKVAPGTSSNISTKQIEFCQKGEIFLTNSSDRVIRIYSEAHVMQDGHNGTPEPIQKLQDQVNKTAWKKAVFSGDGEFIVAGSVRQHALYIWERNIGQLVKMLSGTRGELLLDVAWHPSRPVIASISSGVVSIWAQNQVENWSAFAPDFKELDENVEYEERESEFDVDDEDKSDDAQEGKLDEDEDVDVITIEPVGPYCDSDDDGQSDTLFFLPVAPDVEDPEDTSMYDGDPHGGVMQEDSRLKKKGDGSVSSKKKTVKIQDIHLPMAPENEIHPLLNGTKGSQRWNTDAQSKDSSKKQKTASTGRLSKQKPANGR